jgi:hypothetical protein
VPHGWDNGFMMETTTRTMFSGDLFTQGGRGEVALTESDILGPSEEFRAPMDYYAHAPHTAAVLEKLAREKPEVPACMHGSAWRGDGAALLRSRPAGRVREGDHDDFGAAFAHNHCVGESPEQQAFRCALP